MRHNPRLLAWLIVSALALPATSFAQPPATPQTPARNTGRGQARVVSPEVASDGRVTFRFRATNATDAQVSIGGKRVPMTKNEQGVWTATTDALAPDIYPYALIVDGVTMNDPANRQVQTSFGSFQSMVVVPGPQPWLPAADVPRGAVTRHVFHSKIAGDTRDLFVYTPPGYEARRSKPYPVLYLLHGLGDDAERWMNGGGGANTILDNLIAQGKATPMVIVSTLGYGTSRGTSGGTEPANITGYEKILFDEVMPMIDAGYNVSRNRDQRAIAGLSMGGATSLYVGLNHLDTFAWIGAFSSAPMLWPGATTPARPAAAPESAASATGTPANNRTSSSPAAFDATFPTLSAKSNSKIRLLWIVCGTSDGLIGANRQFKDWLKSKDVRFTEEEVPNMGHVWPLWRQNLTDLAQKLFQSTPR